MRLPLSEIYALLEPELALPLGTPLIGFIALTTLYARIISKVAKMYTNSIKYNSYNSSFANKRAIFKDVY